RRWPLIGAMFRGLKGDQFRLRIGRAAEEHSAEGLWHRGGQGLQGQFGGLFDRLASGDLIGEPKQRRPSIGGRRLSVWARPLAKVPALVQPVRDLGGGDALERQLVVGSRHIAAGAR